MQVNTPILESVRIPIDQDVAAAIARKLPQGVRIVYDDHGNPFLDGSPAAIQNLLHAVNSAIVPTAFKDETLLGKIGKLSSVLADSAAQQANADKPLEFLSSTSLAQMQTDADGFEKLTAVPLKEDENNASSLYSHGRPVFADTKNHINEAPVWSGPDLTIHITEDVGFAFDSRAWFTDPEGRPVNLAFTIDGQPLPAWMHYDHASGRLFGLAGNDNVGQYTLGIRFTDGQASQYIELVVKVHNVNDAPYAPTDADAAPNIVDENAANGTVVGLTAHATDQDSTNLTYSLADDAGGRFAINALTGVVTVANGTLLNYEAATAHTITVRVTDGQLHTDRNFTINLADVNEAPTLADENFSVDENTTGVTWLGALTFGDVDAGDTRAWSIVSGNDDGLFTVSGGQVILVSPPDYETAGTHTLLVRLTDSGGLSATATVTITINDINEAPIPADDTYAVAENVATGTLVATLAATDPDAGDTLSWVIISGNDHGIFALDADGRLLIDASPNYEAQSSHTLVVRATDAAGLSNDATITINITNVNETPVAPDAAYSVAENSTITTLVASLGVSDVDAGDTHTWSIISGNGAGIFALAADGSLTLAASPNYEAAGSYTLVVRATDAGGLHDDATITITITDQNDAPVGTPVTYSVAENTSAGHVLGTVSATDQDAGDTRTFSIVGGNGAGLFAIAANGQLTLAGSPNFESASTHALTVRVTDASGAYNDFTVTVNITDVNEAPLDIVLSSLSVNENSAMGTVVATLSAVDDAGSTHTWQITDDPDNKFALVGNELRVNGVLNHENFASHSVTLRVFDGTYTYSKTFSIAINDINDIPVLGNQTFHVAENSAGGTLVVRTNGMPHLNRVSGFDEDGDTLTWSITSGNDANNFQIDAVTGAISVRPGATLNYEGTATYVLGVTANDGTANSAEGYITINLTNINEAPVAPDATLNIYEALPNGALVSTLIANDPDAGDTRTWSLLGGNTNNLFSLAADGRLTLNAMPNTYGTTVYTLSVRVTDSGGLNDDATITVNITNINNPPVIAGPVSGAGTEDTGFTLSGMSFSDADIGQSYTLTIAVGSGTLALNTGVSGGVAPGNVTGNGTGTITITGATLAQLNATFAANGLNFSPAHNANGNVNVNWTLSDGNLSDTHTTTITLAPVNDAPTTVGTVPVQAIESDQTWSYTFSAGIFADVEGDTLTYTATLANGNPLPAFVQFNAATRTFSVPSIPGESNIGSHSIRITATDPGGLSTSQILTLNVSAQGLTAPAPTPTNIEGGLGGNIITGNDGNDTLYGGYAGSDVIYGMGGNDTIFADTSKTGGLGGYNNDTVYGGEGDDIIYGDYQDFSRKDTHVGHDHLYGEGGNDTIYGMQGHDYIDGGDGNDTLYGFVGNDTIYGGNGNDKIYGQDDDDLIDGGNGDDIISGGMGNDTLTGGAGADIFVYDSHAESSSPFSFDTITDFQAGVDKIQVGLFTGIVNGVGAASGSTLGWYQTGIGPSAKTIITSDQITYKFYLELTGHVNLSASDFNFTGTFGTNGADIMNGTAGNDTIIALGGNDTIDTRQGGIDLVYAGDGDDIIYTYVDGTAFGEGGNDTIYSHRDALIYAGDGNDIIWQGQDFGGTVYGGAGADTYIFHNARLTSNDPNYLGFKIMDFDTAEDKIDLSRLAFDGFYIGARNYARESELFVRYDSAQDLTFIESQDYQWWWPFAIILKGNYASNPDPSKNLTPANFIFGAIKDGSPGDTDLRPGYIAGSGADEGFIGSAGNDVIFVGAHDDVNALGGDDLVIIRNGIDNNIDLGLGNNRAFLVGGGHATLNTVVQGNNTIIASHSAQIITLNGSGGNDFLKGAGVYSHFMGGDGNDTIFGGRATDGYMRGGNGNDYINAGDGSEQHYFEGGAGNDFMVGGYGQDHYWGGWVNGASEGQDTYAFYDPMESKAAAADVIFDFSVGDTILLHGFTGIGAGATELTMTTYVETKLGYVSATWIDLENAAIGFKLTIKTTEILTVGTNLILEGGMLGTHGADTLNGTAGHDNIFGMLGNDTIYGHNGNDNIYGGEGTDTLYGGAGDDNLWGGWANDILNGGTGMDRLEGGAGNDTFVFAAGDSIIGAADTIWDFKDMGDADKINLSGLNAAHLLTFNDLVFETPDITGGNTTRITVTAQGNNFQVELMGWYEKGIDIVATDILFS